MVIFMQSLFCPHCGKELPPEMKFCPYCMERLTQPSVISAAETKSVKKRVKNYKNEIIALSIAILAVLGVWAINSFTSPKAPNVAPNGETMAESLLNETERSSENDSAFIKSRFTLPFQKDNNNTPDTTGSDKNPTLHSENNGKSDITYSTTATNSSTNKNNTVTSPTANKNNTGISSTANNNTTTSTTKPKTSSYSSENTTLSACAYGHKWVAITQTVHHDEVGHFEDVEKTKFVTKFKCAVCYKKFDSLAMYYSHFDRTHLPMYEGDPINIYRELYEEVQETETYTTSEWVIDKAAYDETVTIGHKCSVCGEER